jgi:cytochrome c biogenesis protein CcmG/thiol:disulfide interchange protein DsbE
LLELSNNKGVPIYGINYKDSRKKAIDYLKRKKDPFKFNIFDSSGDLGIDLGVYGAPETFLISKKGTIIDRHVGALNSDIWDQKFRIYFHQD